MNRLLFTGLFTCIVLSTGTVSHARPLGEAAKAGDLERVRQLIDEGAKLNARTGFGTPLHWAIQNDHNEVAELLVARGAKLNVTTAALGAPLHVAATKKNAEMVLLLLDNGANPNIQTGNGFTPLHKAAEQGAVDVIRVLLEHGADVNALSHPEVNRSLVRQTPIPALHLAAAGNHTEAVAVLREAGAASPTPEPVAPFMETASAERGQELYTGFRCGSCHPRDPDEQSFQRDAPLLQGVVERPVASQPGYDYSPALRKLGGIWTEERIYVFISNPLVMAPGTKMAWQALGEPQQRADLIAYLRTLGETSQ